MWSGVCSLLRAAMLYLQRRSRQATPIVDSYELGRALLAGAVDRGVYAICGSGSDRLPEHGVGQTCAECMHGSNGILLENDALVPKVYEGSCFLVGSWLTPPSVDGSR